MYKVYLLLMLISIIFSSCVEIEEKEAALKLKEKKDNEIFSSAIKESSISTVSVVNNQLIINGSGLSPATRIELDGNNFEIESNTGSQIIANGASNFAYLVGQVFSLIIADAHGAATYQVSFTLQDGAVTGSKIANMGAADGQVLAYNGTTSQWEPKSVSGLSYVNVFDASSNTNIATAPSDGDFYVVITAGSNDPDGMNNGNSWNVGDWAVYDGSLIQWNKIPATNSVTSVAGKAGAITLSWADFAKTGSKLEDLENVDVTGIATDDVLSWDGSKWVVGPLPSFSLSDDSISSVNIQNGAITNDKLASDIDAGKIVSGTIIDSRLSSNVSLLGASIDSLEITDGSVANIDLASDINAAKIGAGTLSDSRLSSNVSLLGSTIDSTEIEDNSISNADISPTAEIAWSKINKTGAVAGDVGLGNVTNDAQLKASDLDTNVGLTANSDTKIPSQKAVKAYVDTQISSINEDSTSVSSGYIPKSNGSTLINSYVYVDGSSNVGIGTISPDAKFHVHGNMVARKSRFGPVGTSLEPDYNVTVFPYPYTDTKDYASNVGIGVMPWSSGSAVSVQLGSTSGNYEPFYLSWIPVSGTEERLAIGGDTELFSIRRDGNVGIGTTAPSEKLHIVGNLRVQGSTDCTLGNGSGATNCTSDKRLKDNVKPIPNALEKIKSVKGVEFVWNYKSLAEGKKSIGVIAQDIQKVFPTAVIENDEGYLSVDYAVLVAPLIEATKDLDQKLEMARIMREGLSERNKVLEREVASLKEENAEIKAELKELRKMILELKQ